MKLLQIINSLQAGGAEKLVVETSIRYKKYGIQVSVLLLDNTETALRKCLEEQKIPVFNLGASNIYNPINIFKIIPFLKKYDIIHAHLFPTSYWLACSSLLSFKKNNIVFTEHNTTNRRRSIYIFKLIDKIIYKQFKAVISISDAVDNSLKNYLGPGFKNKIQKIYNGIDLEKYQTAKPYYKQELGFNNSDILLIQVSSFTPQKDQKTLIKSMQQLPGNIKLLLVGHGPLFDKTKNLVNNYKLNDRVKFLGVRNDVPRLLKSADIVILSSHFEGLSLSCVEGMASGKPFVSSNTPGLGDIVKSNGLVFEDNDFKTLAQIINNLVQNKVLYSNTVKKCLLKAEDFDIETMIKNHVNLYNSLN